MHQFNASGRLLATLFSSVGRFQLPSVAPDLSHGEMNGGAHIAMITAKAVQNFAEKVMGVVLAPLTLANFARC